MIVSSRVVEALPAPTDVWRSFLSLRLPTPNLTQKKNYTKNDFRPGFPITLSSARRFSTPSGNIRYLISMDTNTCPKCGFSAIRPYTPSVNPSELLQSGFSSLDVSRASILTDVANLDQELQQIESLYGRIRDRREQILKDLGGCKALLAPIRRLPRETLLHIFSLASSDAPHPFDAPWILGEVCSTWRSISRSYPSLWTNIDISRSCSLRPLLFIETYISLSGNLPLHLHIRRHVQDVKMDVLTRLASHSGRWSTLDLEITDRLLCRLLNLASTPATRLTNLRFCLLGESQPVISHAVVNNLFSSSPIKEAKLEHIHSSSVPINMTELRIFHIHSYDPAELLSMLQQAERLTEFAVTPVKPPPNLTNAAPIPYPPMTHTSLQRLSLVVDIENSRDVTKNPVAFDYVTLPALQQLEVQVNIQPPTPGILTSPFESVDYARPIRLVDRSQCNLTTLTFSIPISVEALLVPILIRSPAIQRLDICVNASVARDVFHMLTLEQGLANCLKELHIQETMIQTAPSGILEDAVPFHAMILSRLHGDRHLDTLRLSLGTSWAEHRPPLPVAQDSPFRDLFRIKDEGINVEFLLDRKDCLVDGEAHARFFGST
ncbi:uncharacterized protein EV420DRAFT_503167 [Desarmillaria tabescens]|uniref:F-box domain-containing protein n=1 Tax=Armillaria tabescens TaxID=1929756 RepID=A0AA39N4Y1_ARMTA|nr:uncharacterized protein EV420DRAFT_503167 [Desarmillaria tabescens]KAK0457579.1 hypothetical protein EV420DRAFT_503167 [Desarmillaria tabescens]